MLQLKGGEPNHSFVLKCCNDTHYHSTAPCYNCCATLDCLRHSTATPARGTAASKLLPISVFNYEPALCLSAKPVPSQRRTKILCHKG